MAVHGMEGVRFHTRLKTLTAGWPGIRASAEYVMPAMPRCGKRPHLLCGWPHTAGGGHVEGKFKGLRDRGAIFETALLDAGQRGSPGLCG